MILGVFHSQTIYYTCATLSLILNYKRFCLERFNYIIVKRKKNTHKLKKKKNSKKIHLFLELYESQYTIRPPKLPTRIIATNMLDYRGFNMCATSQFNNRKIFQV